MAATDASGFILSGSLEREGLHCPGRKPTMSRPPPEPERPTGDSPVARGEGGSASRSDRAMWSGPLLVSFQASFLRRREGAAGLGVCPPNQLRRLSGGGGPSNGLRCLWEQQRGKQLQVRARGGEEPSIAGGVISRFHESYSLYTSYYVTTYQMLVVLRGLFWAGLEKAATSNAESRAAIQARTSPRGCAPQRGASYFEAVSAC